MKIFIAYGYWLDGSGPPEFYGASTTRTGAEAAIGRALLAAGGSSLGPCVVVVELDLNDVVGDGQDER